MALLCLDSQENIIDWQALSLSLQLAAVTLALLLPPGMLLADGKRIPCEAARPLLYGSTVTAFVRPEDVRMGRAAAALPEGLDATVTHVEFLGPVCRIGLEAGHLALEAECPTDQLRELGAEPGAQLPVAIPAERVMVFPDDV